MVLPEIMAGPGHEQGDEDDRDDDEDDEHQRVSVGVAMVPIVVARSRSGKPPGQIGFISGIPPHPGNHTVGPP